MKLADVGELFYIVPIANVATVLAEGILSHERATRIAHESVASDDVQSIRASVRVLSGGRLHSYANLYFCARNPMMFVLTRSGRAPHESLAVLRVSPDVLSLEGVVITDGNAASGATRFAASPAGLDMLDAGLIHAQYWAGHATETEDWEHKRRKHAEVLVPDLVPPGYLLGAYASCEEAAARLRPIMGHLDVTVAPYVFFR